MQAAKNGVPIDGSTIYVNMEPCFACAKMLINAGVKKVVCNKRYHRAQLTRDFFKQAGVELIVLEDTVEKYEKQ
jgi:dCMP deaminase